MAYLWTHAMYVYCYCGYPLLVTAEWTGAKYHLVLHDSQRGKTKPPIIQCPQCDKPLVLGDLALRWSTLIVERGES